MQLSGGLMATGKDPQTYGKLKILFIYSDLVYIVYS